MTNNTYFHSVDKWFSSPPPQPRLGTQTDPTQGPDHSKEQLTGPSKVNTFLLRAENDIIIPIISYNLHNKEDCRTNCTQTAVSSLTFCRLPGFSCVLSIILIAT